jgi:ABC-type multidrug transport system fused ATPase/permease subunit
MLNDAQTLTALAPSLALFPGFAVLLFVLGLNLARRWAAPPAGAIGMTRAGDTAAGAAPLLQIDALDVSIGGSQIIKDLSLDVAAGEILGLVGASGIRKIDDGAGHHAAIARERPASAARYACAARR